MNILHRISVLATMIFATGCAHPPLHSKIVETPPPAAEKANITVEISGDVNKPGIYSLGPPFTPEHAIRQAGSIDQWGSEQNRMISVIHSDGRKIVVHRRDYGS